MEGCNERPETTQAELIKKGLKDLLEESAKDPWQHRSKGMRCVSCMWFVYKGGEVGRCRRHAPTMSGYPVVYKNDWCGDHKLNENY